jgi:hypothetical protein
LTAVKAPPHVLVNNVTFSTRDNAVLTLVEGASSAELLKLQTHVEKALTALAIPVKKMESDVQWQKLMVHGISVPDFEGEEGMNILREEINRFNPRLELATLPRWLTRPDTRVGKEFSSVIIAVRTQEEKTAAEKGVWVHGRRRCTSVYITSRPSDQCTRCLHFGHNWQRCKNDTRCKFCSGLHLSSSHHCKQCEATGKACPHLEPRCANCKADHFATHPSCPAIQRFRQP